MSEELKSNLQILSEYLGCEITEINPDKKITVADATMLMHLYSAQFKQALAKADEWGSVEIPPKESGRYWCYVKEINDLGVSYFQWNCSYDVIDNTWSDNLKLMTVTHWTNLLPNPQINKEIK